MQWQQTVINFCIQYGFQICGALIILGIGLFIASWAGKLTMAWLMKKDMQPPVRLLLTRVVKLVILALVLVLVLDKFGVQIAPLIAGIGVAGVGIGLALQGVLSNLMAGLTIIFTKPFLVGEYIELLGVYGQVQTIELFSTTLLHSDMSRVIIPNRKIVGEILHNHGKIRQLNLAVGVAYGTDLRDAVQKIRAILTANERVLKTPEAVVGINSLDASSIAIAVQPWVAVPDYVAAQLEVYEAIVEKFRADQIEIPFPQTEIRVLNSAASASVGR